MNRLIEDILEISRLEAEGFKLELEETQLTRLIKPIITGLAPVAEKKGLKLFYVQHGNLPKLFVDKKRITEVITNLIDNAIKFTEVGQITVETRRRKNNILVKVSDSGCGIPEEFYSKIFEPFSQAEGMVNRTHGGTGLGLSICKGIVKQHKGDIWFESKIGKGTTFYFILPLPKERLSFSMLNYVIHMLF